MVQDIRVVPMNVPVKKFEANGKKIVVWPEPPPDKYGEIIMPDGSKAKMSTPIARVIAVGSKVEGIAEGDRILLYDMHPATEIRYDRDVLYAIEAESIVGILPRK